MLEKEMYLKRMFKKLHIIISIFIAFFFLNILEASDKEQIYKIKTFKYLTNIDEFESRFIQIQENDIQKGSFFKKKNRLRVNYDEPSNIVFVIKKNSAMYYNKNLGEVQYFNTKKNNTKVFFDLFNDINFLDDAEFLFINNMFHFSKTIEIGNEINLIKIFFEESPIRLRKIEIKNNEIKTIFYINNMNFNPNFEDDFFSLANPLIN